MDVIRNQIRNRFGHILDHPAEEVRVGDASAYEFGRPQSEWHAEAFDRIDDLRARGMTINDACRKIAKDVGSKFNVSDNSIISMYRKQKREQPLYDFCAAILDGDLDEAVRVYPRLTAHSKRKLSLE